ncbi:alpha/beta hydrolase family protein [Paenibacillus bovis]|uniref:Peptidase S9 prolyl oligopeptidase catalytic domain-containing protein n=1 Tax=Paenibacillus bovis TaxID=1616788 RepID=A0A172ZB25_9BACL|nr:prolyl oligopeptidase family serine peptidase [Paenibacillus bovis]ANF94845.1 hypothetical protein AR543_01560 [Paenibacillus bovis]
MDTRARWSGWYLETAMQLPFRYDEEQLEEMMDRYAVMLTSPEDLRSASRQQATVQEAYGTIELWRTEVIVTAAAEIQIQALEGSDLLEKGRLYCNGQHREEAAEPIQLYPGSHRLSLLLYCPESPKSANTTDKYAQQQHLPGMLQDEIGVLPLDPEAARARFSLHSMDTWSEYIEAAVSPNGKWAAMIIRHPDMAQDMYTYQLQIYQVTDDELKLHRSLSIREPHTLRFSADSLRLAFVAVAAEGYWDMIVCLEMMTGQERILISGLHHAGQLAWHPQADELFFVCDDHDGPEEYRVLHIRELPERLPWWRPQKVIGRLLLQQRMPGGEVLLQRLSPKMHDVQHLHIHGSSGSLYYIEEQRSDSVHPVLLLHQLNLLSGKDTVQQLPNALITGMQLSPSGEKLSYIGSRWKEPTKENGYGVNIYDLRTHILQLSDGSIYQLDHPSPAQSGTPVGIARLNQEMVWVNEDHLRYVITAGSATGMVDCYGLEGNDQAARYTVCLDAGAARLHSFTTAGTALALYSNQGRPYEPAWYTSPLQYPEAAESWYPIKQQPDTFAAGEAIFSDWSVYQPIEPYGEEENSDRAKARMWIAWPEYSARAQSSSIPLVVYLYGGASPLLQGFDPLHQCLVTHGMAVLVLNPLGAAGYGAGSADRHVNDWGRQAVEEISEMLEQVLERYPVINRQAIGIYGGSYGGFLSYLLAAHTSWFSAVCTIGGISNITSYWGSSQVGYLYGLSALSGSYPWSHPEIYVQQSPLFYSQHIEAPVLMLHGEQDHNVPVGESEQLFTALRMQNKPAEMMIFAGEQHAIRSKPRAYMASQKYIVAWFEKYLNRNPQLWEELTGPEIEITLE